jgi:hypothetical protein
MLVASGVKYATSNNRITAKPQVFFCNEIPPLHATRFRERTKLNLICAISPKGQLRFMCHKGKVTADVFVEFLGRLMHGTKRPIFLVVTGFDVCRSAKVRKFVEGLDRRLYLFRHHREEPS